MVAGIALSVFACSVAVLLPKAWAAREVSPLERLETGDTSTCDAAGPCLEYTDGFELCRSRGSLYTEGGGHL